MLLKIPSFFRFVLAQRTKQQKHYKNQTNLKLTNQDKET